MKPEWSALGEALRALRSGRDLLQKEVAARTHDAVNERSLRQFERGERRPGRDQLLRMLTAYKIEDPAQINEYLKLANFAPLSRSEAEQFGLREGRTPEGVEIRVPPSVPGGPAGRRHFAVDENVLRHLDKILHSETFSRSAQVSSLLRYLVEKTLAGGGDDLKDTVIALDLFHQNPRALEANVVRAAAGRLRLKLSQYYEAEGRSDPIRITIPKGGYKPVLTRTVNQAAQDAAAVVTSPSASAAAFELFVDPSLSSNQISAALDALADYYRACGGVGLQIEFEQQEAEVRERVDA